MATRTDAPTRREQILKEAARLFAERGFHGVGVDEIGAAVGISGPGLYRHFAGKDAMLAELLVGISGRLLTGAKRRIAEADGSAGAARGAVGARSAGGAGIAGRAAGAGAAGGAGGAVAAGGADGVSAVGGPAGVRGDGGGSRRDSGALLDSLIEGHIDFALDDRPLITLHDRELDRLRDSDRKLVRQLQRQYVELWVEVLREVYPALAEPAARSAVHSVFGLLNSTPHLGRPGSLPGRAATAELLHRMARGAFAAAADGE
ncbi:TetR/AcrR family transcriptional regulator [Streptomyces sp. MA5143a]|uniref:TetR/AcrR family transcriptional regulator n=1 Tax=Streptomyces sp. MA5143a TaxID=2083010 RepID=UPI000D1ABCF9|nr:TetR/AcrR family transcriptional regulator [Streptomyces sp. MA5143a]SPF03352.1 HTH-type transcriptional repressor KstR2 [Streptomyces sp. MA5143a]